MSHAAINTNAKDIHSGVASCLQAYAEKLRALKANMYIERHELLTEIQQFLQSLAAVSPTCSRKMPSVPLKDTPELQDLLMELAQDQQILNDIVQTQIQAKQAVVQEQLRMSEKLRAALAEQKDYVDKLHKASIDSLPHDRMRALGALFKGLVDTEYLLPIEEKYYPKGFNFKPEETNSYEDLLRSKYGDTIYQPGGPKP